MRLGDICKVSSSKRIFAKEYTEFGIPFYRGQEISELASGNENVKCKYISYTRFTEIKQKYYIPKKNDILITAVGTIGNCYLIDSNDPFYFKDGNLILLSNFKDQVLPQYIYLLLSFDNYRKIMVSSANNSNQKALTIDMLQDLDIPIFPLDKQKKIVDCIMPIINLINNNNIIINKLTNKIKDIYSYWFVSDYAKVRFNEGLEFAKKSIVDNDLCSLISSGIQKFNGLKDYFSTSEINGFTYKSAGNLITYEKRESRANMQPVSFSVWFAKMKNSIKHISFSKHSYLEKRIILSTGFAGLKCSELSFSYIWSIINTQNWFEKQKDYIATGSTQEALNETTLSYIKIEIPNNDCLTEYYKQTQQLIFLIEKLTELNNHLLDYKTDLLSKIIK